MIIKCPECNKEVSDQAATCPNCGVRIQKVQTIEKTGKGWKLAQLIGILAIVVGFVCCYTYGITSVLIGGVILFIGACIGAWWCHG